MALPGIYPFLEAILKGPIESVTFNYLVELFAGWSRFRRRHRYLRHAWL